MKRFMVLTPRFVVKGTIDRQYLFDLREQCKYQIEADQFEFLKSLEGSKTIEEILAEYDDESQPMLLGFIEQLRHIDAIKESPHPISPSNPPVSLAKEPHLAVVHFEFTGLCNLRCRHCYQEKYLSGKKADALTFEEISSLATDFRNLNVEQVGISGGEPFFDSRIFRVLQKFEENQISINSILTNGILMNRGKLMLLRHLGSLPIIFVSVDSLNVQEFAAIRNIDSDGAGKALNVIVENIKAAIDIGFPVMVNTIVTRNNVADFPEMYSFLRQVGVDGWRIALPKKVGGYKENQQLFNVSLPVAFEAYFGLLKMHLAKGARDKFRLQIEHFYREDVIREFRPQTLQDFACDYEGKRNSCCIKPNGDVTPCPLMNDFVVGNLRKESLENIWYSESMCSFKNTRVCDIDACKVCEYNYLCATGCRANAFFERGSLCEPDPFACFAAQFFTEKLVPYLENNGIAHSRFLKPRTFS